MPVIKSAAKKGKKDNHDHKSVQVGSLEFEMAEKGQSACLRDLSPEEKMKVANLIQQVVQLGAKVKQLEKANESLRSKPQLPNLHESTFHQRSNTREPQFCAPLHAQDSGLPAGATRAGSPPQPSPKRSRRSVSPLPRTLATEDAKPRMSHQLNIPFQSIPSSCETAEATLQGSPGYSSLPSTATRLNHSTTQTSSNHFSFCQSAQGPVTSRTEPPVATQTPGPSHKAADTATVSKPALGPSNAKVPVQPEAAVQSSCSSVDGKIAPSLANTSNLLQGEGSCAPGETPDAVQSPVPDSDGLDNSSTVQSQSDAVSSPPISSAGFSTQEHDQNSVDDAEDVHVHIHFDPAAVLPHGHASIPLSTDLFRPKPPLSATSEPYDHPYVRLDLQKEVLARAVQMCTGLPSHCRTTCPAQLPMPPTLPLQPLSDLVDYDDSLADLISEVEASMHLHGPSNGQFHAAVAPSTRSDKQRMPQLHAHRNENLDPGSQHRCLPESSLTRANQQECCTRAANVKQRAEIRTTLTSGRMSVQRKYSYLVPEHFPVFREGSVASSGFSHAVAASSPDSVNERTASLRGCTGCQNDSLPCKYVSNEHRKSVSDVGMARHAVYSSSLDVVDQDVVDVLNWI